MTHIEDKSVAIEVQVANGDAPVETGRSTWDTSVSNDKRYPADD